MPNTQTEQRIVDNQNKAVIRYTGIFEAPFADANVANSTLVDVSTLANALNANGYIMSANTHPLAYYGTTIKRIYGSIKSSGFVKLQWKSNTNPLIAILPTGSFDYPMDQGGASVALPNPGPNNGTDANNNGDIIISTFNGQANDTYTIFVELRKDNRYYDAGQTTDPVAFNHGPARGIV